MPFLFIFYVWGPVSLVRVPIQTISDYSFFTKVTSSLRTGRRWDEKLCGLEIQEILGPHQFYKGGCQNRKVVIFAKGRYILKFTISNGKTRMFGYSCGDWKYIYIYIYTRVIIITIIMNISQKNSVLHQCRLCGEWKWFLVSIAERLSSAQTSV